MFKGLAVGIPRWPASTVVLCSLLFAGAAAVATGGEPAKPVPLTPHFSQAVAFDVSSPLSTMAWRAPLRRIPYGLTGEEEIRPERGEPAKDTGYSGDGAVQSLLPAPRGAAPSIPGTTCSAFA